MKKIQLLQECSARQHINIKELAHVMQSDALLKWLSTINTSQLLFQWQDIYPHHSNFRTYHTKDLCLQWRPEDINEKALRNERTSFAVLEALSNRLRSRLPLTDSRSQEGSRRHFYKKCINKDYTAVHLTGDQLFKTLWKAQKSSEAGKLGSEMTRNGTEGRFPHPPPSSKKETGNRAAFREREGDTHRERTRQISLIKLLRSKLLRK